MLPFDAVLHNLGRLASDAQAPAGAGLPRQAEAALESRQGFVAGGLRLMVSFAEASELADMPAVAALPGAPAWFRGMANLQGRLLPVFDLARFAGLPETRPHQLLLLGRGADAAGITIDAVPQRLRFAATALRPPAAVPLALRGCVGQACVVDGHEWLTLHTDRLLDALSLHDAPGPRA